MADLALGSRERLAEPVVALWPRRRIGAGAREIAGAPHRWGVRRRGRGHSVVSLV